MLDDSDVAAAVVVVEDQWKEIVNDYLSLTMRVKYTVVDDDDSLMSSVNQMQKLEEE